ncbi:hypothetical protein GGS23DRAFT_591648 [Durotheca rogersii]|uniref:uncharacterized protein n=1 Tax=Durotheca rogersii TaxID=419775 RepID=UPI0022202B3F|nr:uncharacterized protein GGS23DRAFT_591646 [Durotheca rogersii]XP_051366901.1 uncharacterized protein GGS23DRAFT_591648 [Durotheca rogersii]KAI5849913.1 hypothetical protein GGS23DRAFT_591646 [Durotheca rogersii]KAI5849915.1 hypothetical protein GGS23DRAFT_591648 [Durotheca rogersii]
MSITLNTLFYNLILLLLMNLVFNIKEGLSILEAEAKPDLLSDIKILTIDLERMIHPVISKKLQNKGITVLLNSISGFDSEFELKSSLEKLNVLLSVQIAVNSCIYIKVPIIKIDGIKHSDFGIKEKPSQVESEKESEIIELCCRSIDFLIRKIRVDMYFENDKLINMICSTLEEESNVQK